VIEDGERITERIRPDPPPAPSPAREPSIEEVEEEPEESGQSAPDFGVSDDGVSSAPPIPNDGARLRLIRSERVEADAESETDEASGGENDGWVWNGKDWSVTETPGSAYTRKFVLRLKATDGKYHYALSCSLNLEEFNRRFAGRRSVTDRRLKPVRENDYDKFKTFIFEAWYAEAIRADSARLGHAARLV
jgi:hypothetical protein